eukprot:jgi/Picre1/30118/NNA_005487.t1
MRTTAKKEDDDANKPPLPRMFALRIVETDDDIECVSWLRATSFHAYPEERKFAGKIHQLMIAEEESKSLKALRLDRRLRSEDPISSSRDGDTVTLMASCHADSIPDIDEKLCYLEPDDGSKMAVLGSLDIHAARAMPGEVLIGSSDNAAYLANVCTASAARPRNFHREVQRGIDEDIVLSKELGFDSVAAMRTALSEEYIEKIRDKLAQRGEELEQEKNMKNTMLCRKRILRKGHV